MSATVVDQNWPELLIKVQFWFGFVENGFKIILRYSTGDISEPVGNRGLNKQGHHIILPFFKMEEPQIYLLIKILCKILRLTAKDIWIQQGIF